MSECWFKPLGAFDNGKDFFARKSDHGFIFVSVYIYRVFSTVSKLKAKALFQLPVMVVCLLQPLGALETENDGALTLISRIKSVEIFRLSRTVRKLFDLSNWVIKHDNVTHVNSGFKITNHPSHEWFQIANKCQKIFNGKSCWSWRPNVCDAGFVLPERFYSDVPLTKASKVLRARGCNWNCCS